MEYLQKLGQNNLTTTNIFVQEMDLDEDTWLRAKAWALWKATFELCQIADKNSPEALIQKRIIEDVIYG